MICLFILLATWHTHCNFDLILVSLTLMALYCELRLACATIMRWDVEVKYSLPKKDEACINATTCLYSGTIIFSSLACGLLPTTIVMVCFFAITMPIYFVFNAPIIWPTFEHQLAIPMFVNVSHHWLHLWHPSHSYICYMGKYYQLAIWLHSDGKAFKNLNLLHHLLLASLIQYIYNFREGKSEMSSGFHGWHSTLLMKQPLSSKFCGSTKSFGSFMQTIKFILWEHTDWSWHLFYSSTLLSMTHSEEPFVAWRQEWPNVIGMAIIGLHGST